jgi:hypothetical protein
MRREARPARRPAVHVLAGAGDRVARPDDAVGVDPADGIDADRLGDQRQAPVGPDFTAPLDADVRVAVRAVQTDRLAEGHRQVAAAAGHPA